MDLYPTRALLDAALWSVIVSGFSLFGVGLFSLAREVRESNQRHRLHERWMAQLQADIDVDDLDAVSDDSGPQEETGDLAMLTVDPNNYHDAIMPEQIRRNPELTKRLQLMAEELAADGREISSDDVHGEFERRSGGMKLREIPGVDPRIMGAVFNVRKWIKCGIQASERKDCHYRPVRRWRLRNPTGAPTVTAS